MTFDLPIGNYPYIMVGLVLWTVWGLSWLAAALWRGPVVKDAAKSSYRWQLAIAVAGFFLLFIGSPAAPRPLWLVPLWLGLAMITLIGAGLALAWWARLHLGALWSGGIVRRADHRVVDTGPYALVRHPIYTALIMGAVGFAVVKATPFSIAGALLMAVGFGLKARVEERFLAAELGEAAYADYRRRVPMLVPFTPPGR